MRRKESYGGAPLTRERCRRCGVLAATSALSLCAGCQAREVETLAQELRPGWKPAWKARSLSERLQAAFEQAIQAGPSL